jgi:hypothetical protein
VVIFQESRYNWLSVKTQVKSGSQERLKVPVVVCQASRYKGLSVQPQGASGCLCLSTQDSMYKWFFKVRVLNSFICYI